MFLYGKNSVLERIKVNPGSIKRIYLRDNFKDPKLTELIRSANIPTEYVSEKKLTRIKRADRLQGIVAEIGDYRCTPYPELLNQNKYKNFTHIFLDRINDPHNLGSIIRSAACFGRFGVVIPKHNACEVNETVLHVASGGENYIPVSLHTNLSLALREAKDHGFWVAGTVVEGGEDLNRTSLPFPLCLVMGSEGKGIRYGLEKQLDLKITLPMEGAALSFNVAMAAAIFCYEIDRQRGKNR